MRGEPFVRAALHRQQAQLARADRRRRVRAAGSGPAEAPARPGAGLRSAVARLLGRRQPVAAGCGQPLTGAVWADRHRRPTARTVTVVVDRVDLGDGPRVLIELPEAAVLAVTEPACAKRRAPGGPAGGC